MSQNEQAIITFTTRVRQMILRFKELKKENQELYAMVEQCEAQVKQAQAHLAQQTNDYNSLKMAKMMEISNADLQGAKDRLAGLIRDVNKCIAILSNDQ